jgi:hypothetical protein
MATVTLALLESDALLYADQRPGGSTAHIDPTTLTRLVNQALKEFYDLLIRARGHEYFLTSSTLAIVSGTATYTLPTDLYELVSVTLEWGTRNHELVRPAASTSDRSAYVNLGLWTQYGPKAYRMRGAQAGTQTLELLPTPASNVTARLQYIPTMTELTAGQSIQVVNGWGKLVSLKVALEMLSIKGLSKQRALVEGLYQEQLERVEAMASEQDANEPKQVRDVGPDAAGDGWMRGWYVP